MTRRQSYNQWSSGIAAHPAPPQKSQVKNSAEIVLASIFFDQDGILLNDYPGQQRFCPIWKNICL